MVSVEPMNFFIAAEEREEKSFRYFAQLLGIVVVFWSSKVESSMTIDLQRASLLTFI